MVTQDFVVCLDILDIVLLLAIQDIVLQVVIVDFADYLVTLDFRENLVTLDLAEADFRDIAGTLALVILVIVDYPVTLVTVV